jgi:uncharacterized membrane-anchored protein YhcB (DUF1043 family)
MHFLDVLIALCAGVLVGILVGRRTSLDRLRCQELETELASARAGANRYREEVASHFTKTSELVQGLTLQYRTVYDHLAEGARTLCPERMLELSQGDSAQALLAAGAAEPHPETTEPPEDDTESEPRPEGQHVGASL